MWHIGRQRQHFKRFSSSGRAVVFPGTSNKSVSSIGSAAAKAGATAAASKQAAIRESFMVWLVRIFGAYGGGMFCLENEDEDSEGDGSFIGLQPLREPRASDSNTMVARKTLSKMKSLRALDPLRARQNHRLAEI